MTMDIAGNINSIKKNLPEKVQLVAVSKTKPNEDILVAYNPKKYLPLNRDLFSTR